MSQAEDDLDPDVEVFMFLIFIKGKEDTHGYIMNNIGFTDPNDCYDSMFIFLNENKKYVEDFYDLNEDEIKFKFSKSKYSIIGNYYLFSIFDNDNILIKYRKQ